MTRIMGVLNVTPDSFSDGGRWASPDDAIAHAVELMAEGADFVDVGGESTRPGAPRVPVDVELGRVMPVLCALAERGVPTSIDTMNSATARAAVEAGAGYVNDVSGGLADPDMLAVVAELGVTYLLSHWRGHSADMNALAVYGDVVADVRDELRARLDAALAAGIRPGAIVIDPGLGFAKRHEHNWSILGRLDVLSGLGFPVLLGASRKRFLGALLPEGAPMAERDLATAVVSVLAAQAGAWGVRVHDVHGTRLALEVMDRWDQGGGIGR